MKLGKRYDDGVYSGTSANSNEQFVARADRAVTRCRAISRLPLERRWDAKSLLSVLGTPDAPNPGVSTGDGAELECHFEPRLDADHEPRERLEQCDANIGPKRSWYARYKITWNDAEKHGPPPQCFRCTRLMLGDKRRSTNHPDEGHCMFYHLLRDAEDARFMKALKMQRGIQQATNDRC